MFSKWQTPQKPYNLYHPYCELGAWFHGGFLVYSRELKMSAQLTSTPTSAEILQG